VSESQKLGARWSQLPATTRRILMFAGIALALVVMAQVFKRDKITVKKKEAPPEMSVVVPDRKDAGLAEMRTQLDAVKTKLDAESKRAAVLDSQVKDMKEGNKEIESRQVRDLTRDLASLREEVRVARSNVLEPDKNTDLKLPDLPPPIEKPKVEPPVRPKIRIVGDESVATTASSAPGAHNTSGATSMASKTSPAAPASVVASTDSNQQVGGEFIGDGRSSGKVADNLSKKSLQFIPGGTMIQGVLITGADVPTSGQAQKNTVPVLMRIKKEAVLPNRVQQDVRECFIILSGYGVMSSERAKLRSEIITCVRTDGGVIEAKIDGFAVDTDGKEGIKGTLVTKQGALLARGMLAGFVSGFSQLLQPVPGQSLSINSSQTSMLSPSVSDAATAGAARGLSQAANDYAKFFLDMAKEMHPVIEIPSGVEVTLVLVRGVSLALASSADKKGARKW
jgi:conjugal transfer pilus assembly protein TraB